MRYGSKIGLDPAAHRFLKETVGADPVLFQVAGDASFRRYFRITHAGGRAIFMDAPPEKEDSAPFVDIARFLGRNGIPVPGILAARLDLGYLLLEDFGDLTYLAAFEGGQNPDPLYEAAVATLLALQSTPVDGSCIAHRRPYDRSLLRAELALFTDWYLEGVCGHTLTPGDRARFETVFGRLLDRILQQRVVLVHRDYHSRNLMWRPEGVGVLDFQDAMMGPVTYDLASLLRDCYVAWPPPFRARMTALWLEGAKRRWGFDPDPEIFRQDFDCMAVQRNLKAVGIFGRLSRRDGKHRYLEDIPRTLAYVQETVSGHREWAELGRLLNQFLPRDPLI